MKKVKYTSLPKELTYEERKEAMALLVARVYRHYNSLMSLETKEECDGRLRQERSREIGG